MHHRKIPHIKRSEAAKWIYLLTLYILFEINHVKLTLQSGRKLQLNQLVFTQIWPTRIPQKENLMCIYQTSYLNMVKPIYDAILLSIINFIVL